MNYSGVAGANRYCRRLQCRWRGRPGNRGAEASRKVRTPQSRIAANGRPARRRIAPSSRGTGPQRRVCGAGAPCAHRYGHLRTARPGNRPRRRRVKRGNLYPEQHQIGMRRRFAPKGGSSKHAGRWLEPGSNAGPRGMIARRAAPGVQNPAYRPVPPFFSHPSFRSRGRASFWKRGRSYIAKIYSHEESSC